MLPFKPKGYTYYAKNESSCCMVLKSIELNHKPAVEVIPVIPSLADRLRLELDTEELSGTFLGRLSYGALEQLTDETLESVIGCIAWTENDFPKLKEITANETVYYQLDVRSGYTARVYKGETWEAVEPYMSLPWVTRKECFYIPPKPELVDILLQDTDNLLKAFLRSFPKVDVTAKWLLLGTIDNTEWLGDTLDYKLAPSWHILDEAYYKGPGWCLRYTAKEFIAALRYVKSERKDILKHYGVTNFEVHELNSLVVQRVPTESPNKPPFTVRGNGHTWMTTHNLLAVNNANIYLPLTLYFEDRLTSKYCLPQTTPFFVYN